MLAKSPLQRESLHQKTNMVLTYTSQISLTLLIWLSICCKYIVALRKYNTLHTSRTSSLLGFHLSSSLPLIKSPLFGDASNLLIYIPHSDDLSNVANGIMHIG